MILYSHFGEKPHVMRLLHQLMIIRNIIPIFNFENRNSFKDLASVAQYTSWQVLGINILLVNFCITEKFTVHFPVSIIYQFLNCYGYFALWFEREGVKDHLWYAVNQKLSLVILQTGA